MQRASSQECPLELSQQPASPDPATLADFEKVRRSVDLHQLTRGKTDGRNAPPSFSLKLKKPKLRESINQTAGAISMKKRRTLDRNGSHAKNLNTANGSLPGHTLAHNAQLTNSTSSP